MREVPDHQRAGRVRRARHGGHVVHRAGPVVDVREHQHRGRGPECRDDRRGASFARGRRHEPQRRAVVLRDHALRDVEIGREVVGLADDDGARRIAGRRDLQCDGQDLEEIDRRRVGDDDLAGRGPDQRRERVADAARRVDPAGVVPAADQPAPPFARHRVGESRGRRARQRAERIAVEVDEAVGQVEAGAQMRDRVGRVEREALLAGRCRPRTRDRSDFCSHRFILDSKPFRQRRAAPTQ